MNMLAPGELTVTDDPLPNGANAPARTSHLIAVNCHPFHATDDIQRCITALIPAVVAFRRTTAGVVAVRIFWHRSDDPPAGLRILLAAGGLTLCQRPHCGNGTNLNSQIEYAIRGGYDLFYRVDGDDTVRASRFIDQADLFASSGFDICGCALEYRPGRKRGYVSCPPDAPGPRAFLENRFVLHPTMVLNVATLAKTGLRYGTGRLEDKELLMNAAQMGLRIRNTERIGGVYFLKSGARRGLRPGLRAGALNLRFLVASRAWPLVPYALLLCAAQIMLGPALLRRLRAMLFRGGTT